MPITSCAPRLAAINARLVIQTGTDRPRGQKVFAGGDLALGKPADAQDEGEVDDETDVVDGSQCQEASVSPALYPSGLLVFHTYRISAILSESLAIL